MADAAITASGQVYNGHAKDGTPKFDRIYAVDLSGVELSVFGSSVTESWNHGAHVWLKHCIYFRMNRLINRDVALYLTYVVSAFWHGFYPMYFVAFILYAVYTEAHKEIHILCCKYKFLRNPLILIFIYITTNLGTDYLGMLFDILLFRHIKKFVAGLYWIPIFSLIALLTCKFTSIFILCYSIIEISKLSKEEAEKFKKNPPIPYTIKIYEIFNINENQEKPLTKSNQS